MKNNKWLTYAIITTICVILFLIWFIKEKERESFVMITADATQMPTITEVISETEDLIIKVYITGEVVNPNVYEVAEDSRIEDILEIAGGATAEANLLGVNLSQKVYDEQQIIIPKLGEEIDKFQEIFQESNAIIDEKVNINTASKEQLKTLSGIGDSIADAIIEYRLNNGGFENIEDIKNVYRIGDKTFERFKDKIKVK